MTDQVAKRDVLLATPRGFCAGVDRAIDIVSHALQKFGAPIYVRHEIVHNTFVVNDLKQKGAIFIEDLDEVPPGATLVFSAHGVSRAIQDEAKARGFSIFDATCPLVTKVHLEAIKYAKQGYHIFLIGHEGHDEVIGTMGQAPGSFTLVETADDVAHLPFGGDDKLAYLTQTTLSVDDASRIISRLKERFPQLVGPPKDDICYATQNRQEAVRQLSREAELVLVLGSQNSSNSQRLAELAREEGRQAHLIDGADEIDPAWFEQVATVAITAGASAPEQRVQDCVAWLTDRFANSPSGVTVEERVVREEDVYFPLPKEIRSAAAAVQLPMG